MSKGGQLDGRDNDTTELEGGAWPRLPVRPTTQEQRLVLEAMEPTLSFASDIRWQRRQEGGDARSGGIRSRIAKQSD